MEVEAIFEIPARRESELGLAVPMMDLIASVVRVLDGLRVSASDGRYPVGDGCAEPQHCAAAGDLAVVSGTEGAEAGVGGVEGAWISDVARRITGILEVTEDEE